MLQAALLLAAVAPADVPRTYLLSIVDLPVGQGEQMMAFALETWGVQFKAVCRIPQGWRIRAGHSATPEGELSGEGSHGATWFGTRSPPALRDFVLVTMHDAVQRADIREKGGGPIPASFKGHADISTDADDRKVPLTYRNIRLTPAARCP